MNSSKSTNWKRPLFGTAIALFAIIGGLFLYAEVKHTLHRVEIEQQKSTEFSSLVKSPRSIPDILMSEVVADWNDIAIIDVREPEEYSQGRLKGSMNYRLGELLNSEQARNSMLQRAGERKRVFYCHDGDRSTLAASVIASEFGGANYVMERGFSQIHDNDAYRTYWEGSTDILPGGMDYERTPVLKWSDVGTGTLIDLTLPYKPPLRTVQGRTIVHAPILLMSNAQINEFIASLGTGPVIALCDSKVSCFSTRILRFRLEQHGLKLAGLVRVKPETSEPSPRADP